MCITKVQGERGAKYKSFEVLPLYLIEWRRFELFWTLMSQTISLSGRKLLATSLLGLSKKNCYCIFCGSVFCCHLVFPSEHGIEECRSILLCRKKKSSHCSVAVSEVKVISNRWPFLDPQGCWLAQTAESLEEHFGD